MFRNLLLITTALLSAGSIASVDARSVVDLTSRPRNYAQGVPAFASSNFNKNSQFLCVYGGYDIYGYSYSDNYFFESGWKRVAVPIKGRGRAVDTILVQNGNSPGSGRFIHAAIYTNTPSGAPGDLVASGKAKVDRQCQEKHVYIPSVVLDNGKKYWVVESVSLSHRARHSITWAIDPVGRDDAYSQYHTFVYNGSSSHYQRSSYTSPWKRISGRAPFVRVK